jgi:hypothetical protein
VERSGAFFRREVESDHGESPGQTVTLRGSSEPGKRRWIAAPSWAVASSLPKKVRIPPEPPPLYPPPIGK